MLTRWVYLVAFLGVVVVACDSDEQTSGGSPASVPLGRVVADFESGPEPFVDASVPGFTAEGVDGVYRIEVTDSGFSHGQLPRPSSSLEVNVTIAAMTGSGDRLVGVGCAVPDGRGYYLGVYTSGEVALVWAAASQSDDPPTPIWTGMSEDVEARGEVDEVTLRCMHNPANSTTTLVGEVNGMSVVEEVEEGDVGISFTNVALWFGDGEAPWSLDIEEVTVEDVQLAEIGD